MVFKNFIRIPFGSFVWIPLKSENICSVLCVFGGNHISQKPKKCEREIFFGMSAGKGLLAVRGSYLHCINFFFMENSKEKEIEKEKETSNVSEAKLRIEYAIKEQPIE